MIVRIIFLADDGKDIQEHVLVDIALGASANNALALDVVPGQKRDQLGVNRERLGATNTAFEQRVLLVLRRMPRDELVRLFSKALEDRAHGFGSSVFSPASKNFPSIV